MSSFAHAGVFPSFLVGTGGGCGRHDGGGRYKGATLSWHGMKLWVPSKASDQLLSLHASGRNHFAALQREVLGPHAVRRLLVGGVRHAELFAHFIIQHCARCL